MDTFDLTGPLPAANETTLLEASAGTGKTYAVGALTLRYVAELGVPLDEMLIITFGRAASQELRERVREQLVEAERFFAAAASGGSARDDAAPDGAASRDAEPSAVVQQLLAVDEAERTVRHRRIKDALGDFDGATIATTHQFCQQVLRSLGVAGDTEPGATLVDQLDDLVVEVVDDLYLARFGSAPEPPPFDRAAALGLGRAVVGDPQAALVHGSHVEGSLPWHRVTFAQSVRDEVGRRKRDRRVLSYDDLLSRLADSLDHPEAPARARMRARWRVVMVDEFQDTDPVQWEVLDRAFTGHATLVLIGDPKQSIYAFRGGDVFTYLRAARTARHQATLGTNWRSDAGLLRRLGALLTGAALGHRDIVVREVEAAHEQPRLVGAPHDAAFRLRQVRRDGFKLTRSGDIPAPDARAHIARDLAADVTGLLASGATWDGRPVTAGDIAVIVAEHSHGALVRSALLDAGVPAVIAGSGHVLNSPAADEWLALLEALEQPQRTGRVRAAALTCFFGRSVTELADRGDDLTNDIAERLRGWALLLRGRGVAALFEAANEDGLIARVLSRDDGDRLLTDLIHVSHVLHDTAAREHLGLTALIEWVRSERALDRPTAERTRRLDSDAAAVQIVTIHASKGLQYPVVYLPFAYQWFVREPQHALFHDDTETRSLDVSGGGADWMDHVERHQSEESAEELRDTYVALTRACSQVVAWWAPTANTVCGGLHRLLFGRLPLTADVPDRQKLPDDDWAAEVLRRLHEDHDGPAPEVSEIAEAAEPPAAPAPPALSRRRLRRPVDTEWRRTSYSALVKAGSEAQLAGVRSEPEAHDLDDEGTDLADGEVAPQVPAPVGADVPSPMADLPGGAGFGSLVHAVLEFTDPSATDLEAELRRHVQEQLRWWPATATVDELVEGLLPLQHSPLGPLLPGLTLADLPLRDRLCELDFEFPLTGGDVRRPRHELRLRDLAPVLREHLPADDPLLPYADHLEAPGLAEQPLRGYLSGSIDVVFRTPDGRFVIADYKTNMLGQPGVPITAADYGREQLTTAMLHSDYPLQAMLYAVVLHRYLRWRLPDYDPERHLGGVVYLYLRGMCGPQTPVVDGHPAGVFSWNPPVGLVIGLSDALATVEEVAS